MCWIVSVQVRGLWPQCAQSDGKWMQNPILYLVKSRSDVGPVLLHIRILLEPIQLFSAISVWQNFYHLRMWVGNVFSRVYLSVCLYVCLPVCLFSYSFWAPSPRNFIFGMKVHLYHVFVKLEYQGHDHVQKWSQIWSQVINKVKVTHQGQMKVTFKERCSYLGVLHLNQLCSCCCFVLVWTGHYVRNNTRRIMCSWLIMHRGWSPSALINQEYMIVSVLFCLNHNE